MRRRIRAFAGRLGRLFAPQSLRYQLLSRSLFILTVLLLLIGVFQYLFLEQFLYRNKASGIRSQIISVPGDLWLRNQSDFRRMGQPGSTPFIPEANIVYISPSGGTTVVQKDPRGGDVPEFDAETYRSMLNTSPLHVKYKVVKGKDKIEKLVVFQQLRDRSRGLLQVSVPTREMQQVLIRQLIIFLMLAAFALILGLLTFLPILRRTLVPLSNIVRTVGQIDAGKLGERFASHQGQTEIDRLSRSFNSMLARLEASFAAEKEAKEQMRRFIADASHELRTPITSIHGFLEVLLRGAANDPQQLDKSLHSMYGESERIKKLVQDLLLLAKLDRAPLLQLSECSLSEIVREMEHQLQLLAGERTVLFHLETERSALLDRDKIKQVLLNLFHNAVQHTDPARGVIRILVAEVGRDLLLEIGDNGPGIPDMHMPHLFERFYRVDYARARKHGGTGLGLAITKSLVELHGGTIAADSRVGEGSAFRVTLPAVPDPADGRN